MNVFIAGPRAIRTLNEKVKKRIDKVMESNFTILVGDAAGIDKQIQTYCHSLGYNNVRIFASNGKVRNNIGRWDVVNVKVPSNVRGFDFYATKDLEMAKKAHYGFMIWNGKSKGTFNNMVNLVTFNKKVLLYMIPDKQFYILNTMKEVNAVKDRLHTKGAHSKTNDSVRDSRQLSLFS